MTHLTRQSKTDRPLEAHSAYPHGLPKGGQPNNNRPEKRAGKRRIFGLLDLVLHIFV
jgi:hypothetical protein